MFHKEFYPTPRHVIDRMGIDCYDKVVLEPSAGKGDIVDYCKEFGARSILACEINEDLQKIVSSKCKLIASDFFKVTADQVSHVELIVMNPPFSNASKHILHAWHIAPEGCEIIALCNWETLDNRYSYSRTELGSLVADHGSKENLEDCFSDAERKTGVDVGCIHLFKPVTSEGFDYDGFYFTDDEQQGQNGIMPYNDVRAIVNSYVAAVKCFDKASEAAQEINSLTSSLGFGNAIQFLGQNTRNEVYLKSDFSKDLQKTCWKKVFNKLGVEKIVTTGVMKDINEFVERRLAYPFTMRNIFRMIEIIVGNRANIMDRAIVEAVDNFTKHTHENRYGVEGWKTNEGHLLNLRFIAGRISEISYSGILTIRTYGCRNYDYIRDLNKAICYITGTPYESIPDIRTAPCGKEIDADEKEVWIKDINRRNSDDGLYTTVAYEAQDYNTFTPNQWYDWGFFQFKVFKKGTGHFKFKDPKVWELLNRAYAKAKGQTLPEKLKVAA